MENKQGNVVVDIASLANIHCVHQQHIDMNIEVDCENKM
jgi:hypothetical protein